MTGLSHYLKVSAIETTRNDIKKSIITLYSVSYDFIMKTFREEMRRVIAFARAIPSRARSDLRRDDVCSRARN